MFPVRKIIIALCLKNLKLHKPDVFDSYLYKIIAMKTLTL